MVYGADLFNRKNARKILRATVFFGIWYLGAMDDGMKKHRFLYFNLL
jgi:hypothetical protein